MNIFSFLFGAQCLAEWSLQTYLCAINISLQLFDRFFFKKSRSSDIKFLKVDSYKNELLFIDWNLAEDKNLFKILYREFIP